MTVLNCSVYNHTMKKQLLPGLLSISWLLLAICINAQSPMVTWDGFYPVDYEIGNYTANDIKESPYGGYVLVGSRKVAATNGYSEVMLMRVDEVGAGISMAAGTTGGQAECSKSTDR